MVFAKAENKKVTSDIASRTTAHDKSFLDSTFAHQAATSSCQFLRRCLVNSYQHLNDRKHCAKRSYKLRFSRAVLRLQQTAGSKLLHVT
jgi:hypothetical protein